MLELKSLTAMEQDPEIRLGLKLEEWLPKIIRYANINTAGRKPSQISVDLLSLAKSDVPSGKFCQLNLQGISTAYTFTFYR